MAISWPTNPTQQQSILVNVLITMVPGILAWHFECQLFFRHLKKNKAVIKSAASAASAAVCPEAVIKSAASAASPRPKKFQKIIENQPFL